MERSLTNQRTKNGNSMVEILLAITIFAMMAGGILYLSIDTTLADSNLVIKNEATNYAQEGLEAVRNIRDKSFLTLENGEHGLQLSNGTWSFISAPETIDNYYSRTILIEDVYRNSSGDIDETNGDIFDLEMKKVTSTIEWVEKGLYPRSISLTTYLSNWRGDDSIDTTCDDFDGGTFTDTETITHSSPPNDNCGIILQEMAPIPEHIVSLDLNRVANDIVVEGNYAYIATNNLNIGLTIVNIADKNNPYQVATLNLNGRGTKITKSGNYLFIGVKNSSKGLAIVNVQNPLSPIITKTLDFNDYGNQPEVINTLLLAGVDDIDGLAAYNISNIASPVAYFTRFSPLDAPANVIKANGNYAYVGIEDDNSGLRILNIENPSNITQIASLNLGQDVDALAISSPLLYAGIDDPNGSLKTINITNPQDPLVVNTLNVSGKIRDIAVNGNYLYLATNTSSAGLTVVNISNPYSPIFEYGVNINGAGNGIAYQDDYFFVTTSMINQELQIFRAIPNATHHVAGEYISQVIDTGSTSTIHNFIEWDAEEIPGCTIAFQIRTASSEVDLESASWVGPDGTGGTSFSISRVPVIPHQSATGTRYIQYKAEFSSNGVTTPVLNSVRINYSP